MKKIIRPAGFIAFIGIIAVLAAFWFLAAGWLLKLAIEEGGSTAVGAQVELGEVALTFSPFGVTLTNLQVTDPENPMRNLVQLRSVETRIELGKLLMGQLIVDELSAEGVRLNTPRSLSGALPNNPKKEPPKETPLTEDAGEAELATLQQNLPSVDEIFAREPLATIELSDRFQQSLAANREQIEQRLDGLPDHYALQAYQQRIDEITAGKVTSLDDFKRRKAALKQLKKEIRRDKEALNEAKEAIKSSKAELEGQLSQLKKAPAQDLATIREKYSLSGDNMANFGGLLFGEQARRWLERAQPWIEQLQQLPQADDAQEPPVPPRGEGRFIHFSNQEKLPELLIRRAKLSVETDSGNVMVVLTDITHQPEILGRPIRLTAVGDSLINIEALRIDGVFDHTDPKQASDRLSWSVNGWQLSGVDLLDSTEMAISLTQAQVVMDGEIGISRGALQGRVDSRFKAVEWQAGGEQGTSMAVVLREVDQFSAVVELGGAPLSPDFRIRSDLDEKLKAALSRAINKRQTVLEQRLKARLDGRIDEVAGPYREQLQAYRQRENKIGQKIAMAEELLQAQVKDAMDEEQEQLKDRLKDKLKGFKF